MFAIGEGDVVMKGACDVMRGVDNFEEKLKEYAALLVREGLNPQPGQTVLVRADISCLLLARACTEEIYKAGAAQVVLSWSDAVCDRLTFIHGDDAIFDSVGERTAGLFKDADAGAWASLRITGEDPEYLTGVDPDRLLRYSRAGAKVSEKYFLSQINMEYQWLVAACPTPAWAMRVFPDCKDADEALAKLWNAVFATVEVNGDGQAKARWDEKAALSEERSRKLNELDLESLHYTNSLGTDLVVGLPEGHFWSGAKETAGNGYDFIANMPTEEIFSLPHRDRVNGRVYASKPLVLDGNLVDTFWIELKDGKICDVHAEVGEDYLRKSIGKDEGSSYLGEVALVPFDSPISNSGILFYSTLFDENASCHFAFGKAYPCIRGAEKLSPEEQLKLGINQSINHVDFMVGTADLSIVGTTRDGREVAIFKDGNFAL